MNINTKIVENPAKMNESNIFHRIKPLKLNEKNIR